MAAMTAAGWRDKLCERLDARWDRISVFDAYAEGDHRLAFASPKWREAFGPTFGSMVHNWCPLVLEASVERMEVQGFRFGSQAGADDAAWQIWQANGLDSEADMLHTEAVKLEEAYWLVEPPARGSDDPPLITAEHPSEMIVACAPGNRRKRIVALKRWWDDDGYVYATLYLPDAVIKWRSQQEAKSLEGRKPTWISRPDDPGGSNPLREVPVVPIVNAPTMLHGGTSDLRDVIPIQDAVNKLLADLMIGSEYQAFPMRVFLGVEVRRDPVTGEPLRAAQVQASQARAVYVENADAKIAQFDAASLDNYLNARRSLVEDMTATTRTPPHYVTGKIHSVSGDTLKAAETGLVAKVRKKMRPIGEGHETMMRLAFKAMGDMEKAKVVASETIWRDPESRSQAELADALVKLSTISVPHQVLWEQYGFGPTEIARMQAMQVMQDVFAPVTPQPPQPNGAPLVPAPQRQPAGPLVVSGTSGPI